MTKLKQWWANRRRRINRQDWEIGFSWAAGQLLLQQETVTSLYQKVDCCFDFGHASPFDQGALEAIRLLRNSGLVKHS